ncbi:hypothetical protein CBOM_01164 [Ceraceosorus bombacis]|uniref:Uncharacterized protein n=1 Tax=Ceraceosorus bombacis TaxID=401625 RepID=A0A0P1BAW9_9BASI|nr:hypothetical protein CBOM_01164 [Ceraceosorus bombacis]
MPVGQIPAITGKLRKRLILDLSVALGGGTALGYAYCYGRSIHRADALSVLNVRECAPWKPQLEEGVEQRGAGKEEVAVRDRFSVGSDT